MNTDRLPKTTPEIAPTLRVIEGEQDASIVVPSIETEIFRDRLAPFYVGILATPQVVVDETAWNAARMLRARVYIDEMKFLPETARKPDGGEDDADDLRSVQFGVYENMNTGGDARLVGTSRLILKRDEEDLLPVEQLYPEVFTDTPAELGSVETSRVIARHEDKRTTRKCISLALIRAMAAWSMREDRKPVYAVIDASVKKMYDRMEFPYAIMSDLKYVGEYQSENWAVKIDPKEVVEQTKPSEHAASIMQIFLANVDKTQGLGYYDQLLTQASEE